MARQSQVYLCELEEVKHKVGAIALWKQDC